MGSLADHASKYANIDRKLSIIEFAESSYGLNLKLFPAQKFFLKLLVGEPLDDSLKEIIIKDKFGDKSILTLTEKEYYNYLLEDKRISCPYQSLLDNHKKVSQYIFCMGRRASKSVMTSIIVSYKLYELLLIRCPQDYLGVPTASKMGIVMVALSQDSSMTLFNTFFGLIKDSLFFKKHMKEEATKTEIRFWTLKDLEQIEKGNNSVRSNHSFEVSAVPLTPGVRGSSNIFVIFDEFAHFANSSHSTKDKPMDKFIYEALAPSISAFRDPEGNPYGKIFILSSPNGKQNMFYTDYETSFNTDINDSFMFSVRAPTWEINPKVDSSFFKKEYFKDASSYSQEYAAEFLDGGTNWLRDLGSLYYCVEENRNSLDDNCHNLSSPYFLGLDFGLSKDGTAMAICHYEPMYKRDNNKFIKETFSYDDKLLDKINSDDLIVDSNVFVIDYVCYLRPGLPPFENHKVLDIDVVIDRIEFLFQKFPILLGCYDQWSGQIISSLLEKRGMSKKIEMISSTQMLNDSQYKLFSQLLHTKKLVFPEDKSLLKELLSLKVEINSNGSISVENRTSGHDDRFDAICRALYLAYNYHNKPEALSSVLNPKSRFFDKSFTPIERTSSQVKRMYDRRLRQLHNGRP